MVVGVGKADEEAPNNIEETVGRVISASAASSPPPPNSYWEEVRKVVNRAVTCLFPPKIESVYSYAYLVSFALPACFLHIIRGMVGSQLPTRKTGGRWTSERE